MHFTTSTLLALAGMASAQTLHVVSVSGDGDWALKFSPEKLDAPVGDMIQFQFRAGNHSVVQSSFDAPCAPMAGAGANATGFYSGYQLVSASEAMGMIPTYTVMVQDEKPIWAYCSQATHCQSGMAMVINEDTTANATRSLDNYKLAAAAVPASSAGGDTSAGDSGTVPDTDSGSSTGGDSTSGGSTATPAGDAADSAGSASSTSSPIEQGAASMVGVTSSMGLVGLAAVLFML
ncbi:hypothetical protein MGN70_000798 [Eutypa lata]|nr:hypothetical protein MGN70_000798 [Eutypa lata]